MATETELEALSSRELHDKAVHRALTHADLGFLWELAADHSRAEALEGYDGESEVDAVKVSGLLSDADRLGRGAGRGRAPAAVHRLPGQALQVAEG